MEEKVFSPEVVQDAPFPGKDPVVYSESQSTTGEVHGSVVTSEKRPPTRKIATELLSTALNTRSKKILQEFELTQSGGIKIGDFKEGTTGDLRLTPNGLTARDNAGITTFAIDGTTGDATFKGTVQAGAVIAEGAIIAADISADNITTGTLTAGVDVGTSNVKIDGVNNRIIINDGTNDRIIIGYQLNGF